MDEVLAYEQSSSLAEAQKVALRFHDAFLTDPAGLRPEVRAQVLEHFSPAQVAELVFKFIWWSTNRATVTVGDDAPHDETRLTSFHYTELGQYVPHEAGAA
jgi:alkylhydroperoxidase family enzyme